MDDFTKRYNLKFKNAFVFKGQISQMEYVNVIQEMKKIINDNKRRIDGNLTTCTHNINKDGRANIEIIMPLDGMINLVDKQKEKYQIIKSKEIENCLKIRHEGNPLFLNSKIDLMNKYIKDNNLEQISDVYNVIIKEAVGMNGIEDAITEVYVQVKQP